MLLINNLSNKDNSANIANVKLFYTISCQCIRRKSTRMRNMITSCICLYAFAYLEDKLACWQYVLFYQFFFKLLANERSFVCDYIL